MNRLAAIGMVLGSLGATSPLIAQSHGGHGQHGATAASAASPAPLAPDGNGCTSEHEAMGHCTMPEAPADEIDEAGCTPEHAAMGHCVMSEAAPPPSPSDDPICSPEHAEMGHCSPAADPGAEAAGTNLPPGDLPAPRPVAADYADRVWGESAMQPAREALRREHGGGTFNRITVDLAEIKIADGHEGYKFESDAWFGGDINRFVFKVDGEGEFGEPIESVELKALYSRAVGPYFNLQAGARQDFGAGPDRTHAVLGVEGLAPYWLEVDGYLYLSSQGELRASASAEYDQRLTQRLILQPKVEFDLSAQAIPELGIGSGLTSAEFGLRLRYEFVREFAPYIGVVHEAKFGQSADYARAAAGSSDSTNVVIGIRAWF